MSIIICDKCGTEWDAEFIPVCPRCIADEWESSPDIIRPKHDPKYLQNTRPSFRSVLTHESIEKKEDLLYFAAASGTPYYNNKYETPGFYVTQLVKEIPTKGKTVII